ncbi:MAG TPA: putative porin, partial [Chthonomonadaceae bacterium]|nr:putative porin [Chthonomonadaceae bacterium]
MKYSRFAPLGLAGVFLCGAVMGRADTDADRIKRLEDQIKLLQEQMQKLKDDQAARDRAQIAAASHKAGQPMPAPGGPTPTNVGAIKWSGDFDSRFDLTGIHSRDIGIIPEGDQGALRARYRIRMQMPLSNRSDAEIYLSTGVNNSPTLAYTTFGDAFRGKAISFSRAYFDYYFGNKNNPKTPYLMFGKILNPFWRGDLGGYTSEIVWDNDVSPEGAAFVLPIVQSKHFQLSNTAGFFSINLPPKNLLTGLTTDTYQVADQIKADAGMFHAAVSYYVFDNLNSGLLVPEVTPDGFIDLSTAQSAWLLRSGSGLQITNGHYFFGPTAAGFGSNTFNILNLSFNVAPKVRPNRVQPFLHYEYLNNGSVSFDNTGWGITLGLNKSRLPDGKA